MFSKEHPDPSGPSMTKIVPDALVDTNKIVGRILRTGQYPPPRPGAMHIDITQLPGGGDAHAMLSAARAAAQAQTVSGPRPPETLVPPQPGVAQVATTPEGSPPPQTTPSKPPSTTA